MTSKTIQTAILASFNKYNVASWEDIKISVEKATSIPKNGWLTVRNALQHLLNSGAIRRDPRLDDEIYVLVGEKQCDCSPCRYEREVAIHVFNTGAFYTEHGQRIAWRIIDEDTVSMVDVDRGIDYILIVIDPMTDAQVLHSYQHNRVAPWHAKNYETHRAGLPELEAAARAWRKS